MDASGALSVSSRYVQYQATLTGSGNESPTLQSVSLVTAPPPPAVSVLDATVTEGNTGTATANVTVVLSRPSSSPVSVSYATADGAATAGADYTATAGSLTLAPGATTATFAVSVTGDTLREVNETFAINIWRRAV